jgi:uronate dehydrogenase
MALTNRNTAMKLILLTGAAGGVAQMIRPLLRQHYRLRLSDRQPVADLQPGEESAPADLGDMAALGRAVAGVDGIVNLGGFSLESDWETIRAANIDGAYNLFEAARLAGVRRIVFASSNHAVGYHPRSRTIPVDTTVRPDTRYGLSKAFGEALGSLYADKYGAEVLSVRIGHIGLKPKSVRDLAIWLSPRDFVQLIRIGLEMPGLRHEIVYGMSDNARAWWDGANARRLGYRPEDRAEDHAAEVLAADAGPSGDPRVDLNQGGLFCVAEAMQMPNRDKGEAVD